MGRRFIWILPAALALSIAWLSHQSQLPGGVELPHPLDWLAHATAFGALAAAGELAWRATDRRTPVYRRHLILFGAALLYALLDEWHQSFVPGRDASWGDLAADACGAALGLALASLPGLWGRRLEGFGWRRGNAARPDPARPLILVADPHWGEELTGLREAALRHPEADWLFLGDLFELWVGVPGMETEAQRGFLWWVRARRTAGRWVGLWMGNREYFLDGLSADFDLMGEGPGGALPAEGLAWEHGDLVNRADRRYRLWNLLSRSGPVWLLARLLPAPWARALARRLEKALRGTNRRHKQHFPAKAFREVVEASGAGCFLVGHFHQAHREGVGVALPWAHEGAFMVWREGRVERL